MAVAQSLSAIQTQLGVTREGVTVFSLIERDPLLGAMPIRRWQGDGDTRTYDVDFAPPTATWHKDLDATRTSKAMTQGKRIAQLKMLELDTELQLAARMGSFNRQKSRLNQHTVNHHRGYARQLRQTISSGRHNGATIGATVSATWGITAAKIAPNVIEGQIEFDWDDTADTLQVKFPGPNSLTFGPAVTLTADVQEYPFFGPEPDQWVLLTIVFATLNGVGSDFVSDGTAAEAITVVAQDEIDGIDSLVHPNKTLWGTGNSLANTLAAGPSAEGDVLSRQMLDMLIRQCRAPVETQALLIPEELEDRLFTIVQGLHSDTVELWLGQRLTMGVPGYRGRPIFISDAHPTTTVGTTTTRAIYCAGFGDQGITLENQNGNELQQLPELIRSGVVDSDQESTERVLVPVYSRWLSEQQSASRHTFRTDAHWSLILPNDAYVSRVQGVKAA